MRTSRYLEQDSAGGRLQLTGAKLETARVLQSLPQCLQESVKIVGSVLWNLKGCFIRSSNSLHCRNLSTSEPEHLGDQESSQQTSHCA